ncbi:hypothetical protein [Nocardiopsis halotolerans]|nr:hypothetical protein [Nocardiopsis halotolerans]
MTSSKATIAATTATSASRMRASSPRVPGCQRSAGASMASTRGRPM